MTGLELLQSVQYVTIKGERLAVINSDDWESLIDWLETLEDIHIARQEFAKIKTFVGDRQQAGYLKWDDVKNELM